jgi:capsid protein
MWGNITNAGRALFGYDAVEHTGKRKQATPRRRPEDRELTSRQRLVLSNSVRDLQRNFAIAAWAIRKHLDYVSTFTFQANTGDDALDELLEELITWWSRPLNCDATGRLSLSRMIRMGEARRTVDGDVLINQLADGRLQGIEGDRIAAPKEGADKLPAGVTLEQLQQTHGVWINENGRAIAYAVNKRTGTNGDGLEFDRMLPAGFAALHGYFDRFDQVRGVSPMTPAINSLQDVYENFGYALMKSKVAQLFALNIYRENSDQLGELETVARGGTDADGAPAEAADEEQQGYKIDFGKGPMLLDLEPGDRAEILESKTPSTEFQNFTNAMIGVSLKSLDIPFSFYDESFTNWSGQRQAWIQYDQSAEIKREDNRALLSRLTAWRLGLFIRDGDLELPRGMSFARVLQGCTWISRGIPWLDPLKEITADIAAIKSCLIGPETAGRQRGLDVYKMIDERARVEAYAKSKNVTLEYNEPPEAAAPPPAEEENAGGKNGKAK